MRLPIVLVFVLAAGGGGVAAQEGLVDVEVEPITCWWRSSTSAVRSGEPFTLLLTCAVVETESTKVIPDQSRLDPSVVQLEPFEVIGGSHAPDMRVPGKRFFQYEYRLRLINESAFGGDIDVPELEIGYRIESAVARGEAVQGRDLKYNLQPISIRLLSLVPSDTMDIREAPAAEFAAVEARESRSALLRLIARILFVLSGVVLLVMVARLVTRGHEVEVVTTTLRDVGERASARTVVATVDGARVTYLGTPLRYRWMGITPTLPLVVRRLAKPDVVHVMGFRDPVTTGVAAWCRVRRVPYVFEPVGMFRPRLRKVALKRLFDSTLTRGVASGARLVVVSSPRERDDVAAAGIDPTRIRMRGNAFPDPPPPGDGDPLAGIVPAGAPVVLYVGRIAAEKGIEHLVEAARALPDVHIVLAPPWDPTRMSAEARKRLGIPEGDGATLPATGPAGAAG